MTPKFNLVKGQNYQVINTKFRNTYGLITSNSTHEFIESTPCYDPMFHGVSNPENYICYTFKLPKQFGKVRFYQFEITEIN